MTSCANTSACDTIGGVLPAIETKATEARRRSATEDTKHTESNTQGDLGVSVANIRDSVAARDDAARLRGGEGGRPPEGGPSLASASVARAGQGRLCVARVGSRSVVTRAYATSPLRLLTPANHGPAAWIYTSSYGGGFVDGDHLDIDVDVQRGAAAFLSTQSATKVYRSPTGTRSTLRADVGEDALLVLAPDPVVCFANARYRQEQRFSIASSAGLVVVDTVVSGRHAAGERWAFLEYRSLIEITIGGRMAVHDPVALRAADGDLAQRLGRFDVLATVVLAGAALRAEAAQLLERVASQAMERRAELILAASPLGPDGCILRLGATSTEQTARAIRALLHFLPSRLDDDPWRRKW